MWNMLKTNLILEKSNKKNLFACIIVVAFVFGLVLFIQSEELGNSIKDKSAEFQSLAIAVNKFQNVDASDNSNASDIYKNLVLQKQLVATQIAALKLNKPDLFLNTSIELTNLREKSYDMEGFDKVASHIPSKSENQLNGVLYEYMKKTGMAISIDALSFFQFLAYLFALIGSIWFIFMSIYSSGIMVEDFQHTSLIKGYPITFDKYVLAKCTSSMLIVGVFIIELFICSLPLIYFKGLGNPSYPIAVFDGDFSVYPIYKYLLVCILYMIVIAIFTILLSVILNVLLKNMYLTLFVQLLLYIFPILFPTLMNLVPFNPFNYLNITSILQGETLNLANPVVLNSTHGLIYIGISIVIMVVIIKLFLTTGKLKRV
ncbi:ABC transporter [Solibacillus sp. CAU 1738]|uniref:ABC transporter n=1 Tax=Solibacillus sp. CAU 1738 TaxID=3140363 RepID=UPI003261509E